LRRTRFKSGVDGAFESCRSNEAFLFKDDKCATINYSTKKCSLVGHICTISEAFPFLKGTPFTCDIEAAFAGRRTDDSYEVFLFKERNWAWVNFGCSFISSDPDVFCGTEVFPPLKNLLPRQNFGLDRHDINHCGCESDTESDDIPGSSRHIFTHEEAQWVGEAWLKAIRSGRRVTTVDIYREIMQEEEAKANKSIIGS